MALTFEDINELENGQRDPIAVGEIPFDVAQHLALKVHNVYLSSASLHHIRTTHPDIDNYTLLLLPICIEKGLLVREIERPHMIICIYENPTNTFRFVLALKIAQNGTEIWVSSFYRAKARQTKSILRRGMILQTHK